jgi:manganese transport protein
MPHVVYLHSALSRDRFAAIPAGPDRRRLLSATRLDVTLAMVVAGAVNIGMLLLAAGALRGAPDVDTIAGAHAAVDAHLGEVVGILFAVGLLASGLASTAVGCQAGGEIMAGLLHRRLPVALRRAVTLVPALIILALGVEPTTVLVLSQVVLSLGLPFVLIPLVRLTSNRSVMGADVNRRATTVAAWIITAAVGVLNLVLVAAVLGLG